MLKEKQLKTLLALGLFAVAFAVYLATMAPTVSFWDCGELVGASNILGNPHPPGNPLFTTLARVFILIAPFKEAATRVNFISALTSALTVMMCYLFVVKVLEIAFARKLDRFIAHCSALIGATLVMFSDTFWFSAVEAEVYGTSMLLVLIISWLSLDWYEHRGTPKGRRNLILICYLGFLGMGVHPFSFISIPAVAVFILLADKELRTDIPLLLTGAALLSIIYSIGDFIWYAAAMLAVNLIGRLLSKTPEWKTRWGFSLALCLVALLGFSSYAYVPIRSSVSPKIDENEPRTWPTFKEYLERKQYGSESMIVRAFHRRGMLLHQLLVYPHMGYGGYMLQQYFPWKVGETRPDENEPLVREFPFKHEFHTLFTNIGHNGQIQMLLFLLLQAPFLYGGYLLYKRNRHLGAYLLLLYGLGSYALIFYMNFADGTQMEMRDYQYWKSQNFNPQMKPENVHIEVRDRDYFFTPGFIFMGILFGVASAFLLNKLKEKSAGGNGLPRGAGLALLAVAAAVPAWSNWKEHDRTGDYIPWDYAYNLLQSCQPNSVLFTNGDNDTFPLWFIQEVEHIRTDVRVVNLSLVNTNWYIKQLKSHEPKLNIGFSDEEIDQMEPQPWPRNKKSLAFRLPNSSIEVDLAPLPYLKVQDIMVIHIVQNNYPARPIHFAVTVGDENMMGLEKHLMMEGMVYTLVEAKKNKEIDPVVTARMVDSVYRFRGLGDPKLYVDLNTEGLLTNYSATNFRLVMWAQDQLAGIEQRLEALKRTAGDNPPDSLKAAIAQAEKERADKIAFGEKYLQLNAKILPREWRNNYYGAQLYQTAKDYAKAEAYYKQGIREAPNPRLFGGNLAQLYMEQNKFAQAESLLNVLKAEAPNDFELWYGLSDLYQKRGDLKKARDVLAEWLRSNPGHQYAGMVSQQIQFLESQIRNPPQAPANSDSGAAGKAPGSADAAPKPGAGGVPGLAPAANGKAPAKAAPAAPASRQKDTAMKGSGVPAGKS